MTIEIEERDRIEGLIKSYRDLHDEIHQIDYEIRDLEARMRKLYADKDRIIGQIETNRETESVIMKEMTEKYGDGKIDVLTLDWIKTEQK